jgi:hypothetical protein
MNKFLRVHLLFTILIAFVSSTTAQTLIPYSKTTFRGNKPVMYGYKNEKGDIVVKAQYLNTYEFKEGMGVVRTFSFKYGFVNEKGKEVIPAKFDYASSFSEGLASVEINDREGYINTSGKLVIPTIYDAADSFSEGFAAVKVNGKRGYINKNGDMVIAPQFGSAGAFADGFAEVTISNMASIIDATGKIVTTLLYDHIDDIKNKTAIAYIGNTRYLIQLDSPKATETIYNTYEMEDGTYTGEVASPRYQPYPNGYGKMVFKTGNIYEGYWENKVPNKKGKFISKNETFEGDFKDGRIDGWIKKTVQNEYVMEGNFRGFKPHGEATYTFTHGAKKGDVLKIWYDDGVASEVYRHQYKYANGDNYEGYTENFLKHGNGTLTYSDGKVEKGYWEKDQFIGSTHTDIVTLETDGNVYIGQYLLNNKGEKIAHGQGERTQPNGIVASGQFVNGTIVRGTINFPDGNAYYGEIKNGKMTGHGTIENKNGDKQTGTYLDGVIQDGHARILWANGKKYEGAIKNRRPHGKGEMIFPDGQRYEGDFDEGKRHGEGYTHIKGERYFNKWVNDQPIQETYTVPNRESSTDDDWDDWD